MFLEDSRVGKKGGPAIFKSLPFPKIKFLRNPNTWLRQQKNLPNFWQMVIGPWFWFLPTLPCALQNAFEYLWTTRVSKVFICNLEFEFYTNKLLLLHLWHSLLGVLTRISVHPVSPWHAVITNCKVVADTGKNISCSFCSWLMTGISGVELVDVPVGFYFFTYAWTELVDTNIYLLLSLLVDSRQELHCINQTLYAW